MFLMYLGRNCRWVPLSVFKVHSTDFVHVVSCVHHTFLSVAVVSFQVYNSVYVLVISKLLGVPASRLLKRKCIRLLFLLVHRKGTVDKLVSLR